MGCSSSSPATSQDETGSVEPESFSFKRTASSYENGESFSRIAISSPHGWVSSLRSSVSSLIRMKCVWCGSSAALLSEFCSCFQYLTKRSADPLHARGWEW